MAALGLVLGVTIGACARPAERVAEHATPSALEGAVGALAEPELQQQIADIATQPEVQRAAENFVATATDGFIFALSEEERRGQIAELTGEYVTAVSQAMALSLGRDLSPEVRRMIAGSVDASIQELASERNIARIEELSAGLTESLLRGMLSAVHNGAAPALTRSLLRDSLRPGLISFLDEDMNRALGLTAREISRQTMIGLEAGLAERRGGFFQRLFLEGAGAILAWLLLAILVVSVVLLVRSQRQLQRENARRKDAVLRLAQVIKSSEGRPWAPELRESLRNELRDQEGAEFLRDVLREQPDLRMRPDR